MFGIMAVFWELPALPRNFMENTKQEDHTSLPLPAVPTWIHYTKLASNNSTESYNEPQLYW